MAPDPHQPATQRTRPVEARTLRPDALVPQRSVLRPKATPAATADDLLADLLNNPIAPIHASDTGLLRGLLEAPPPEQAAVAPAPALRPVQAARPATPDRRRMWRDAAVTFLAVFGIGMLLLIGRAAFAIGQNITAMVATPSPMPQQVIVRPPPPDVSLPAIPTLALLPTDRPAPQPGGGALPGLPADLSETAAPLPSATPTPEFVVIGPTLTPTPGSLGAPISTPGLAALATLPALGVAPIVPPAGDAFTIVLLGTDQRPDEPYNTRSDTIMLARVDPQNRRVALLSLPRDLVVNIPGYGFSRINAAHAYGGVPLVKRTLTQLLGIQVDYSATINFYGFIAMIDAIGGVTINVEKEIYDPAYPTMDYGYTVVHFLPGVQAMDGDLALKYARTRHGDSDWERMKRQQDVIRAVVARLRGGNPIDMLRQIESLTGVMREHMRTDVPIERIIGVAWALRDLTPETIETYRLDGSMMQMGIDPNDPNAGYALPGTLERLTRQFMGQP